MDFFDILLAKKLEDDRDPKVEGLSVTANGTYSEDGVVYKPVVVNVPETPLSSLAVTANGTYTAPSGTAYNEVNVDVPLPENAYLLEEYEDVPTDIASFTASDAPLKSLTASIVPVQAGSGDPSPTNVRPISGWTECEVIDDAVYGGFIDWNQLAKSENPTITVGGVTFTKNNDNSYTINSNDLPAGSSAYRDIQPVFQIPVGHKVYIAGCPSGGSTTDGYFCMDPYEGTNNASDIGNGKIYQKRTQNCKYRIYVIEGTTVSNKTFKPTIIDLTQMFGSTIADYIYSLEQATAGSGVAYFKSLFYKDYYSYNSGEITNVSAVNGDTDKYRTYTIPFTDGQGQSVEVFGGELDVVNGVVTPCPYYASYNGEQLTGEWISDRDVYSPNTTPTIGAQVVNIGATDTSFSTHPTSIKSLDGVNNVFASTGDVEELKYFTRATS